MPRCGAGGEGKRSQLLGDVDKEPVATLGKMIAEGQSLVIESDDDVEGVALSLVICCAGALLGAAFLEVQRHGVVVIADEVLFAIKWFPRRVGRAAVYFDESHGRRPKASCVLRYAHGFLDEVVVDVDA